MDQRKSNKPHLENQSPDWLKELRLHSWEMELLITGFVLIGLLQLPEYLTKLHAIWQNKLGASDIIYIMMGLFFWMFNLSSKITTVNLIALLLLRGYWIGIVGLSSVFPEGINYNRLLFSVKFTQYLKKKSLNLERSIISLDKICSSIFAFTFLIICMTVSLVIFLFLLIIMTGAGILALVFLLAGLLYGFDFFSLGLLKKIKVRWISKSFYYMFRFISLVTLSFLYESIYYHLVSNVPKKVIGLILIIYVGVAFSMEIFKYEYNIFFPDRTSKYEMSAVYYNNLRPEKDIITKPLIQSDVIKSKFIKLFIPFDVDDKDSLLIRCPDVKHLGKGGISPLLNIYFSSSDTTKKVIRPDPNLNILKVLNCFQNFYIVTLNDSVIKDLRYLFFRHPNLDEPGIVTFIPTEGLKKGINFLSIRKNYSNETQNQIRRNTDFIPFWLE